MELWLYESKVTKQARIHKAECRNCNNGMGQHGKSGGSGRIWSGPFTDEAQARAGGRWFQPSEVRWANCCAPRQSISN